MGRPVTRSELAREAGVSPAAVTKQCKGRLAPACIGKKLDRDHPEVVKWLAEHDVTTTPAPKRATKRDRGPTAPRPPTGKRGAQRKAPPPPPEEHTADPREDASDEEARRALAFFAAGAQLDLEGIEALGHLTIAEVVARHGTFPGFKEYLDALKRIEEIREKRLKNEETDGRLIERELVRTHVFGAIEASNRRLLADTPKTLAARLYGMAKSGSPLEEAEEVVRDLISQQLRPVKSRASKVLRDA